MKPTKNYGLSDSLIDAVRKSVEEALVGGQKKLDVDKDGKLEKSDFASLRAKKDVVTIKPKLKEANSYLDSEKRKAKWHAAYPDTNDKEKDLINRGLGHIVWNQRNPNAPAHMKSAGPKKPMNEWTAGESYEAAKGHLEKANSEKKDSKNYHFHLERHHEAMGHWHASKGRNLSAEKEFNKSEAHNELGNDLKEEYEQMDEADLQEGEVKDAIDAHRRTRMDQMSRHSTHDRERAHERHQAKLDSIHNNSLRWQNSKTDADIHGDKERMARDTHDTQRRKDDDKERMARDTHDTQRRKDDDEDTRKTFNVMRDRIKNRKSKNEEVEQMDEAPLRTVNALVGYPKLNKKVAAKGTPGSEDERNKAAAGLRKDRSGLGRRAYTGDQHYDVRREDVEQMDEVKLADLPRRKVVGKSYGADYVDPEGADETAADMKKAEPKRKSGEQGPMKRRFIKDKSKLRMQYK